MELQIKKAELAKLILSSDNEDIINKLSELYHNLTVQKYPCDYSEEDVLKACETAIQEYEAGTLVPGNQIKRKTL